MKDYSYIFNAQPAYIDNLYAQYKSDPSSIEDGWRLFFEGFDFSSNGASEASPQEFENFKKEFGVHSIIEGFRARGHLLSTTNPIKKRKDRQPHLDLADYSLTEDDLNKNFKAGAEINLEGATLQTIINRLKELYIGNIGYEYIHIKDREKRMWIRERIEKTKNFDDFDLNREEKTRILDKLTDAVIFENFLNTKYVGQKRFSLEGGESTIAAIDRMISSSHKLGVEEVVIGMAHRGRLNVLANIMGKTYEQIFSEFEGTAIPDLSFGDGDVKYHLGYSSQVDMEDGKKVHLKLVPNPSHLEAVDPVVQGFSRAKADILYDSDYDKILPILIHGDAAIAGQGVVYEVVQMSNLEGYRTGGTVHFVINNQVGFTTDFDDARSSTYCTAAAYLVDAPVFHVNGDDPEAVIHAVQIAIEYRQKFNCDVFIDLVSYRKHGHNEGDDPKFTQPHMYSLIKKHKNPREVYIDQLVTRGDIKQEEADKMEEEFWKTLQDRLDLVKEKPLEYEYQQPEIDWKSLKKNITIEDFKKNPTTGISSKDFDTLISHLLTYPDDFDALSKTDRLYKGWNKLVDADEYDWSLAELAAYGSILMEGKDVRMSGQDVKRGTFSHRHAILNNKDGSETYNRLSTIKDEQGRFMIYNSLLSEFAVLGFEFGYSLATPNSLVLWEAQFGDFSNGSQTMIDQFVTTSRSKWQRMSGLVMLLPHGYEGQGPEHSSARLERFLQLAGEENITVVNITKSANFFHALRRQLERNFRVPLIVMSPKSLLRHPKVASKKEEFLNNTKFQEVIDDEIYTNQKTTSKVDRLLLCSGKVYYDLLEKRDEMELENVAIVRLEQLYPLPEDQINKIIKKYKKADLFWVQEEPQNMGAWWFILSSLQDTGIKVISRKTSSSPATGYKKVHTEEQDKIVKKALGI